MSMTIYTNAEQIVGCRMGMAMCVCVCVFTCGLPTVDYVRIHDFAAGVGSNRLDWAPSCANNHK